MKLGVQVEGKSPDSIKEMAVKAFRSVGLKQIEVADVGSGKGNLIPFILPDVKSIATLDDSPPAYTDRKVNFLRSDLNKDWPVANDTFDFVFSLEVIEHVENPRHFMREFNRILKPGGYGFLSTPNNLNFFSRINFVLKGEHRYFKDLSYPAHITCLVKKDIERLLVENQLQKIGFYYNYDDVVPLLTIKIHLKAAAFSSSIGVLFRKPVSTIR